jgi:predicted permease
MSAFTTVVLTALQSVLQLFLLMGLGIFLQRKMDVLGTQLRKEMSSVIFSITLPCMLVTKVASSLDLSQAAVLLIVPVFAALHIALAYGMALGGARLLASHFSLVFHQGHFTAASALGNCGAVGFSKIPVFVLD